MRFRRNTKLLDFEEISKYAFNPFNEVRESGKVNFLFTYYAYTSYLKKMTDYWVYMNNRSVPQLAKISVEEHKGIIENYKKLMVKFNYRT